jgi:hypothetical protein
MKENKILCVFVYTNINRDILLAFLYNKASILRVGIKIDCKELNTTFNVNVRKLK